MGYDYEKQLERIGISWLVKLLFQLGMGGGILEGQVV